MQEGKILQREVLLSRVFTPAKPVSSPTLFAGRKEQIRKVLEAVNQESQHAIIYGERGVGKTSLANILTHSFVIADSKEEIFSLRVTCDTSDTFSSVWHKVFDRVVTTKKVPGFGSDDVIKESTLSKNIPEDISPSYIRTILQKIPGSIIILDEFDRLKHNNTPALFADCIKGLSDFGVPVTIVIVGVADSISQLISEHTSIERCMSQIYLPRMSKEELEQIVKVRFPEAQMECTNAVPSYIAKLSQGFPHYTHLLGLHSGRAALDRSQLKVTSKDVDAAIKVAVDRTSASIQEVYQNATRSGRRETLYETVLLACAVAEPDEFGYFAASDVRQPMSEIMGKRYDIPAFARHMVSFCKEERGKILERTGVPRRYRYRFSNPLIRTYVFHRGIAAGILPKKLLSGQIDLALNF